MYVMYVCVQTRYSRDILYSSKTVIMMIELKTK